MALLGLWEKEAVVAALGVPPICAVGSRDKGSSFEHVKYVFARRGIAESPG